MLNALKEKANRTFTENGAITYESTGSECLDLFATVGALRRESDEKIIPRLIRAYTENPDIAMKILFFARDIRGGLGERRVFRVMMHWIAENVPASAKKNLKYIAEFGRYDDLFALMGTACESDVMEIVKTQLAEDIHAMESNREVSLLAKWMPSVNASNAHTVRLAKRIARSMGYDDATYRLTLAKLRAKIRIIENNLRLRDYSFNYEHQTSRALFKYKKAFLRNDIDRYCEFLFGVKNGTKKMHADNISPYELVEPYLCPGWFTKENGFMKQISETEKEILNVTWDSLPVYGNDENALAVIDTSGSMYSGGKPLSAAVALSLGLYCAEHSTGAFRNHFIEFSARPQLIEIKGKTFADRLRYLSTFNKIANTNLKAVFDLILSAAVEGNVLQEELPSKLIIISDMEFDQCVENASEVNFEYARKKFASHGYELPQIVFWNVASRNTHQPVKQNEQGVALVSGVTPRLFSMVAGGNLSPYSFMMEVLGRERYAKIVA